MESVIDNVKAHVIDNNSDIILNRKNIGIYLSPSRAIDYDIWRKSRDLLLTFGTNSLYPQTGVTFVEFIDKTIHDQITNSHVIRYKKNYIALEDIYTSYFNNTGFTPYNFIDSHEFILKMSPYWTKVIEQIIPATTLWTGGNLIENNLFGRSKYRYNIGCQPKEVVEILYPDPGFEQDVADAIAFWDPLYVCYIKFYPEFIIDGVTYIGTTGCTYATLSGSTSVPNVSAALYSILYNTYNPDYDALKVLWKDALICYIDNQLNVPNPIVSYEFFTDTDGIEKIKFTSYKNGPHDCTINESFEFKMTIVSDGGCDETCSSCDPDFIWLPYNESCCYRVETTGATAPVNAISLTGVGHTDYSEFGTRIFASGFNADGTGTVSTWLTGGTHAPLWENAGPNDTIRGPMNRTARWVSGATINNTWIGFSTCITGLSETNTLFVGLGADNEFKLRLDGIEILNTSGGTMGIQDKFKYWNVYPITFSGGDHVLELLGLNISGPAGFGMEVYNNTESELASATTIGNLTILSTSSGVTVADIVQSSNGTYLASGYTCPDGYVYSECEGNCVKYILCCTGGTCEPDCTSFDVSIINPTGIIATGNTGHSDNTVYVDYVKCNDTGNTIQTIQVPSTEVATYEDVICSREYVDVFTYPLAYYYRNDVQEFLDPDNGYVTNVNTCCEPCISGYNCTSYDVIINQTELNSATGNTGYSDNTIYVGYKGCAISGITNGQNTYTVAGTYTDEFCNTNQSIPGVTYYVNDVAVSATLSYVVSTGEGCCP